MHKLERGDAPTCLRHYQHGRDGWSQVSPADKTAIWRELDDMQGARCAYCEADISNPDNKHIEHFQQRRRFPQGTFDWNNLFGSCSREDSCGKHKDRCGAYTPEDIVKPDVDDPEHFFVFVSDGTIAIRHGLNPQDQQRARETLRVFNLNNQSGPLRYMRQQAVAGYIQATKEWSELAVECDQSEWLPLLKEELAAIAHLPFATVIKHVLLPYEVVPDSGRTAPEAF
ncbi:hypothetical protein AGMMS50225_07950 [Betaproteobacteria bacterium]|nr:hypothetical protein AGMMS50225_07950 [Betaproteobacteria bacterium]